MWYNTQRKYYALFSLKKGGVGLKKFLCLILVLLFVATAAVAEGFDFADMSLEELLALRVALNAEIAERYEPDSMAIYNGKYIVGEDIKAGLYLVYNDNEVLGNSMYVSITYPDDSNRDTLGEFVHYKCPYQLKLEDGSILRISESVSAHLEEIQTPEWAP